MTGWQPPARVSESMRRFADAVVATLGAAVAGAALAMLLDAEGIIASELAWRLLWTSVAAWALILAVWRVLVARVRIPARPGGRHRADRLRQPGN